MKNTSKDAIPLTHENLETINGHYLAQPDSAYKRNLADLLVINYYLNYPSKKIDSFYDTLEVSLHILDENHLRVSVYRNGQKESTHILKGKLKNGAFILKQQYEYEPELPVILGTSTRHKSRLSLDGNRNLVVDFAELTIGRILLLPVLWIRDSDCGNRFERTSE